MKTCPQCKRTKKDSGFYKRKGKLTCWCKVCISSKSKQQYLKNREHIRTKSTLYYEENKEKVLARTGATRRNNPDKYRQIERDSHLKCVHGLTRAKFNEILALQNGSCKICKAHVPGGGGTWKVDHDHATGKVRGLLCHKCNVGLGLFNDSPSLLKAAARYLQNSGESK